MSLRYNQRSLVVLSLLGVLSAVMSVLSVMLIFQLQPQQAAAVKESPPSTSAVIPAAVWAVLLPVAAVLAALSLTLHLSSAVVCLLHSYFSTELCRGEQDTDRYLRCSSFTTRHRKEPGGAVHPQFRKKTAATGFPRLGHVRGAQTHVAHLWRLIQFYRLLHRLNLSCCYILTWFGGVLSVMSTFYSIIWASP